MESAGSVSFVVVTWNSAATIGELLDSIATQDDPPTEIVIIDNASGDSTVDIAAAHGSHPTIIRNDTNRGLAAANNQGMAAAHGDYYLICNPDTVLDRRCVTALLAAAARHPRAAFVVARLAHPDGTLQPGVGDLPTLGEAILGRIRALERQGMSGVWWDGWAHDEERAIGHGQEACYLVRRSAVEDAGGQDERYALDWEGLDWSERMARAGWEIWFSPDANAVHIGGVSVRQAQPRWIVWSHRGMFLYFADRNRVAWRPFLAVLIALRAGAKLATLRVKGDAYKRIRLDKT